MHFVVLVGRRGPCEHRRPPRQPLVDGDDKEDIFFKKIQIHAK